MEPQTGLTGLLLILTVFLGISCAADRVTFEIEQGKKGPAAVNVTVV